MKIQSTKNNIIVLKEDNQYKLAATFMRMQEYYESPKFRQQSIDLEEYMDWYAEEYGNFTYTSDWNGFNVPGNIVRQFFNLHADSLSKKELNLRDLLSTYIQSEEKFYVIGIHKEQNYFEHEYSHAYYYLNSEYKTEMDKQLIELGIEFKSHVNNVLSKEGYHDAVYDDEAVAYLATSTMPYISNMFEKLIPWDNILKMQETFDKTHKLSK